MIKSKFRLLKDWKVVFCSDNPVEGCNINTRDKIAGISVELAFEKAILHELLHVAFRITMESWTPEIEEILVQDITEILYSEKAGELK